MRHPNSYYLFLILQIDLRDKGALEMVFASTRYNFHLFSCSAVLTLFHFQIIINSFLFCKFLSSMFFIVRQFALQIWCCRPLRWAKSCGWKCAEAIAILWQQCHWDSKSSRSYVCSRLQEVGVLIISCSLWITQELTLHRRVSSDSKQSIRQNEACCWGYLPWHLPFRSWMEDHFTKVLQSGWCTS